MARTAEAQLEHETDRLYGLPLNEFIPARDELAKRLRGEGQRELADQVKGLRKPPVAAWIVNQLTRERELDVQRLLNAGEALTKAQADAATGDSPEAFAGARRDEQRALERLAEAARETIARAGIGAAALDRVLQTLRAASLTPEGRTLLKRGSLSEELEPPGFEALAGATAKPSRRTKTKPQDDRPKARADARRRVKEARSHERELVRAARDAEREAERAQKEADERRDAAARAQAAAEEAGKARRQAEVQLEKLK
ncbi:MAG TPA: hypothetical protein VHQ98_08870 [Gaiellaceae bacterium]|jgi:hypothetical protein|nr:hypothetical protein [Gaiellaceae bacterium]